MNARRPIYLLCLAALLCAGGCMGPKPDDGIEPVIPYRAALKIAEDHIRYQGIDPSKFATETRAHDGTWWIRFKEMWPGLGQTPAEFLVRVDAYGQAVIMNTGWFKQSVSENTRKVQ